MSNSYDKGDEYMGENNTKWREEWIREDIYRVKQSVSRLQQRSEEQETAVINPQVLWRSAVLPWMWFGWCQALTLKYCKQQSQTTLPWFLVAMCSSVIWNKSHIIFGPFIRIIRVKRWQRRLSASSSFCIVHLLHFAVYAKYMLSKTSWSFEC